MKKPWLKSKILNRKSGGHFKSCRFIIVMRARLKVPAKNSPALLFLSRVKAADCCCFSFFFFSPAEEEQSRRIFGGNFQTRAHDGNKAAGLKLPGVIFPFSDKQLSVCSIFIWTWSETLHHLVLPKFFVFVNGVDGTRHWLVAVLSEETSVPLLIANSKNR